MRKKQVLTLFVLSLVGAAGGIVHGIFFDLDMSQMGRLSLMGVIFTTLVVFPAVILLEWIFDLNNAARMNELQAEIDALKARIED
ncbi:MAG: hypothetical protein ACC682_12940 [Gemmatimonadota bacterium]